MVYTTANLVQPLTEQHTNKEIKNYNIVNDLNPEEFTLVVRVQSVEEILDYFLKEFFILLMEQSERNKRAHI